MEGLIIEPPVFQDVEREIGKLVNKFKKPKFVILNKSAYEELIQYYAEWYNIEEYSETILDYPIVLDIESKIRVRIISNCYTEYKTKVV